MDGSLRPRRRGRGWDRGINYAALGPEVLRLLEDTSTDLHAKMLVVDRRGTLVGSANLSHRAMVTAHEMATIIRGPTADRIAQRLDMLIGSPLVARVSCRGHR